MEYMGGGRGRKEGGRNGLTIISENKNYIKIDRSDLKKFLSPMLALSINIFVRNKGVSHSVPVHHVVQAQDF